MKSFITGITGFAGSHLAEHLLACGDDVAGCSRSGKWNDDIPAKLRDNVPIIGCDLACGINDDSRSFLFDFAPDIVYHLAAISVPSQCGRVTPTSEALAANVDGTRRLLELVEQLPRRPRILFVSTRHVYAELRDQSELINEQAPTAATTGYAATKLAAENLIARAIEEGRADAVVARAFNHTGPRQQPPLMTPQWCRAVAAGERPLVVKNLDTWLDLCDVRDVVRAYRLLAVAAPAGEICNVGSGVACRTGDLVRQILKRVDPTWPVEETSPGIRHEQIADISRLSRLTGWRPETDLATTLADTLNYWQARMAEKA